MCHPLGLWKSSLPSIVLFDFVSISFFFFHLKFIFVSVFDYRSISFLKHGLLGYFPPPSVHWKSFKKSAFQTVVIILHHIKEDIQYTLWWCVAQPLGLSVRIYSTKDCLHLSTNLFITNKAAFQLQMCVFVDVFFFFFLLPHLTAPQASLVCPRYSVVTILWGLFYFCVLQSILREQSRVSPR